MQVRYLGWEDPLETEMAAHSSILAWKIPWTAEPGRLLSMGSQRVGHNWATSLSLSSEPGLFPSSTFHSGNPYIIPILFYAYIWFSITYSIRIEYLEGSNFHKWLLFCIYFRTFYTKPLLPLSIVPFITIIPVCLSTAICKRVSHCSQQYCIRLFGLL